MAVPPRIRKLFPARQRPIRRKEATRQRLLLEPLEDRIAPAVIDYIGASGLLSFSAVSGKADDVTVSAPAINTVRIVVVGDTLTFPGATPAGFALSLGNTRLDIDTVTTPIVQFNINLGDLDDALAFGLANAVNVTSVNLQGQGGTDTVTLNPLTIPGILTVGSATPGSETETIALGGKVTAGSISLTSVNSLTGGPVDDVADLVGGVITLDVTGAGNAIGGDASTTRLEIDAATRLDATTSNGNMVLANVAGNLPLGALDAGNAMMNLFARNGAITDANGNAINLTAAGGVTLTTTGTGSAIGTAGDPIETKIGALTATTYDGGLFLADSNGPGLIINAVLAKEGGQTPFIDGNGRIVVFDPLPSGGNPHPGVHDVAITAQGPILLGMVTAPDAVTITSAAGAILDINQASLNILARGAHLVAQGAAAGSVVGHEVDPIDLAVETFSAGTTNGGISLAQGIEGTAESVVAGGAGNGVVVTSTGASLRLRTITAPGNVTVTNSFGSLLDGNGAALNVTGRVVELSGKAGIGTAADPIETSADDLRVTTLDSGAGIHVAETDGLNAVSARTNASDVTVNFLGGTLSFNASTKVLSGSGAALTFETTAGDVKLGVVDAGSRDVTITAVGAIVDDVNDAVIDLRGAAITLNAGTGIGAPGNAIDTDAATLNATTTTGGIFISEANALVLSAASKAFTDPVAMTGGDIDVRSASGDMTLELVSALGSVTLHAGGAILDGNGVNPNVSARTLALVASNGIGSGGDALETSVNSLSASGGAGGGLLLANNKSLTLTSAAATGGAVSISASGNLTLAGPLTATGRPVTLTAAGELIDSHAGNDITAASVTLNGSKIGTSGDRIETTTASITAATTTGGIFLGNTGVTLALTATALGQAADIDISTTGNIVLNTATAQGDTVRLRAAGSITDGNDTPTTSPVNITAKILDVAAPGGIGTPANPLEVDSDRVNAADGGAGGTSLTNAGPLLLTEAALEASGVGTLTFDAASITIENIGDNTAAIAAGRSVVLRTQAGSIVFLDAADTIQTSEGGTITVQAGTIAGSGAYAVLGNLRTDGGSILVQADLTITIGLLNAGTGHVTIQSLRGIILDGNGAALNVVAGTATLSGAGRTDRQNELEETFKIAEAASAVALASAEQTSADALGNGQAILDAEVAKETAAVEALYIEVVRLDAEYAAQQTLVNNLSIAAAAANTASLVATTAATAALLIAGPAQAIPILGDAGAFTVQATIQVIANVLAGVSAGLAIGLTVESIELVTVSWNDTQANFQWNSAVTTLALAIATQEAFAESGSITRAAAARSAIVRDASARIRDQAILARDQASVIGTFAAPLGLQVTGVINVTAGPTDSYLQVVGPTAVDQIQATGGVTLNSTGAISDADAGSGADILGTGLTIVAAGGIGTVADPIETRVATLSATNTSGGDIAIANTAGAPGALDITGVSNAGGGDVIVSNQGSTAAGQGITVSGPISATGAGAGVTIRSGSPLMIGAGITSADAILLEAMDTAGPGDDLTVIPGVTIRSTASSVTFQAGDNVTVPTGATIQASGTITIRADHNSADTTGANVIVAGTLLAPSAEINGNTHDDTFTITASASTPITVNGKGGSDTLNFLADGLPVTILGNQITALGRAPVTFLNVEFVNITNAGGGGRITLLTAAGAIDDMTFTGTGQEAGTFTLNGGIPISFRGVTGFTYNAGDMSDTTTVTPFATSVLPWNVAVAIAGGTGTDRLTYNNVAGLLDSTSVTATAPQAGHIDSPGVTSALNSQLVTFSGVEDVTANANAGEDERLTVNLRDTSAADTANLFFAPAPGADDLQLVGLFDLVIDTDNYVGLTLNGRGGDDTFNVTPGPIPVFVDGGDPIGSTAGDAIRFNAAGAFVLEPGPENDAGGLTAAGARRVSWDHVEGVSVTGGSGTVLGTNGSDAITIVAQDSSAFAGADGVRDFTASVNGGPAFLFLDAATLTVNTLGGSDAVTVQASAPNLADWDVSVTVNGGPSAAGNTILVRTPGTNGATYTPTSATAGTLVLGGTSNASGVTFSGFGQLVYDGQSGNDTLRVVGGAAANAITVTPGAANDAGTVAVDGLLPITFRDLGATAQVVVDGGGGDNALAYGGGATNDTFVVAPGAGGVRVTLNGRVPVLAANIPTVTVDGLGGNDVANVTGDGTYAVIANLGGTTAGVTGGGLGSVALPGIEALNLDAGAASLALAGTSGPDAFTVTPTGPDTATAQVNGLSPVVNTSSTGALTVDAGVGSDSLTVNGTSGSDTVNVSGAAVAVVGLKAVNLANVDALRVNGLAGSDTFHVTSSAAVPISVDGGDPIGSLPGDRLNVVSAPGTTVAFNPGPSSDSGGFVVAANQPISFIQIEALSVSGGGTPVINGTNSSDAITIVARDDSYALGADGKQDFTVSTNGGSDVLFLDTASLTLRTLAGNDQVVLQALAPNLADWNVRLTVDGGLSSALGDEFMVYTPGANQATYSPASVSGGTLVINNGLALVTNVTFSDIESFIYDGQSGGDSFTLKGTGDANSFTATPAVANDAGTLSMDSTRPVTYQNLGLGAGGRVVVDGNGGSDSLAYRGTAANDLFVIDNSPLGGQVKLNARVPVLTANVPTLTLEGQAGDDTFTLVPTIGVANSPYTTLYLDGGATASATGNQSNLTAAASSGLLVSGQTLTQGGTTVVGTGLQRINLDGRGNSLAYTSVVGVTEAITIVASPTAGQGQVSIPNVALWTFTAVPVVFANGSEADNDTLTFQGTNNSDIFDIRLGAVGADPVLTLRTTTGVSPLLTLGNYTGFNTLNVLGLESADTFNVYTGPLAGRNLYINGGGSTGKQKLTDVLNVFYVMPRPRIVQSAATQNPTSGLVSVAYPTSNNLIQYDEIEKVTIQK